jgi:hypothetical protein
MVAAKSSGEIVEHPTAVMVSKRTIFLKVLFPPFFVQACHFLSLKL